MARSRNSKSERAERSCSREVDFGWISVRVGLQVGLRVTRMLELPGSSAEGRFLIKGSLSPSKFLIDSSPKNSPGLISLVSVGDELIDQFVVVMLVAGATWLEIVSQQPSTAMHIARHRVCKSFSPRENDLGPHRVLDGVDGSVCLLSVNMVSRLPGLLYGTIRTHGQHGSKINLCPGDPRKTHPEESECFL